MSGWPAPPLRGGYSEGVAGLARSQMHSSPSSAPDARRFGEGVESQAANGAGVLLHLGDERAPDPSLGSAPIGEPMIRAGLYRFTLPSTRPPAMRPCGMPPSWCFPHTRR